MKTTTYICDVCKQSVSQNELVEIKVEVQNIHFKQENGWYNSTKESLEICKNCLIKKGFVIEEKITNENEKENANTNGNVLKNKILDILDDLNVAFLE